MGQLVFQATLGGQVNLVGPNTASTYNINVPAVAGNMVTTGDTGTVTNTMLAGSIANAKLTNSSVTIGSTSVSLGATVATITGLTLTNPTINGFTGDTSVINVGSGQFYKDTSGNVSIGTTSPGAKLHVSGASASNSTIDVIAVNTQSSTTAALTSTGSTYSFAGVGANTAWFSSSGTVALGNYSAYPIQFVTNGAERARIDSSGRLLVGTTNVISDGRVVIGSPMATTNGLTVQSTSTSGTATYAYFLYNGTGTGAIQSTGTTTSYGTTSDYRLKENPQPMQNALATVAQLKPCTYTWKADGSAGQGFIAHELQEVVPDCVTGEKDAVDADGNPVYQGIDTSFLVATLTAAIQEQQALINNLTERLVVLEAPKV